MGKQNDQSAVDITELRDTPKNRLPVLPNTTKNDDTLQWFYQLVLDTFACQNGRVSPLYLRRSGQTLHIRVGNRWHTYHRRESLEFWRDAMKQYSDLRLSNWSTKRMQAVWDYLQAYAPEASFDNRRYFELANAVLDSHTGELDYSPERFLHCPTTRGSELAYLPEYEPTAAWRSWYETLDEHQRAVRDWSVGSAITGEHGLLFTFGQSRTGKSTLAEAIQEVLGDGARVLKLSEDFGRFATRSFENTTYLYDPDNKGSKNHNNKNYETIHLMASGDPLNIEIKGGDFYQTTNYGFIEVVSNAPVSLTFEQSLVDRVRFCLYTYIESRADGGNTKRLILADKQAWLNYAVASAVRLATGEITRPPIDHYQAYGWARWLKETSGYGRMCLEEARIVNYSEYEQTVAARFQSSKETVDDIIAGIKEINRQLGEDFLKIDWDYYEKNLNDSYYNKGGNATTETPKLF